MDKIFAGSRYVFLLFLIVSTACYDNSDCGDEFSDSLRIKFYRIVTPDSIVEAVPPLVRATADGASKLLFDSLTQTPFIAMAFPVNIYSDTTNYTFTFPGGDESVQAIFRRSAMLLNPDCGVSQSFALDTVFTSLDSARIVNRSLRYGNPNAENLEIYFQ